MLALMQRVFGIETEYGITIQGADSVDVVAESIELVRTLHRTRRPHEVGLSIWKIRIAMRAGFAQRSCCRTRMNRPITKSIGIGRSVSRKSRATSCFRTGPASTTITRIRNTRRRNARPLRQIVAHDKAGERILGGCARRRNENLPDGQEVRLYKNNTDFVGHSYGCHDNYLMRRDVPWDRIVAGMLPFLVTRQIFAGAGKMGIEAESAAGQPGVYQISQRADFFSVLVSIDTMNKRPLVNTRDEPHADANRYRRFHVIIGDANMSEWATALKIGTTSLVLDLIERGQAPQLEIAQPIEATKSISRDQTYDWIIELSDGRKISAIDVQRLYLKAAQKH